LGRPHPLEYPTLSAELPGGGWPVGALVDLYWTQHIQASSLRRLQLAAQSSETLFVMVRLLAAAQDSSPALLRPALRPASDGLIVPIVKRRGPTLAEPLSIALQPTPVLLSNRRGNAKPVRGCCRGCAKC
jgi:hypothetical protein